MTITPLPPAPNRTDPATFSDRADNFVAALPGFVSEANSQAVVVNQDAENAGTSASNASNSATASANSATASQDSATSSANSATASQNSATASANSATAAENSADEAAASAASINPDSIAITGGTIDGTVIGGTTAAAISGTTGAFSGDVTVPSINGGPLAGFRNAIINGNFAFNQRGVSGTVTLAAGAYGHDRWKAGGSGCTYTFATSANVTTLTITDGSLVQIIEGASLFTGTYVLSFTGTAQGKIGGGSFSASGVTGSVTGGTNLAIEFNTGTVAQVQLEAGSVATPFERRPVGTELALCQRYFVSINLNEGGAIASKFGFSGGTIYFNSVHSFPVELRTNPTIVLPAITFVNCSNLVSLSNRFTILTRVNVTDQGTYRAFNSVDASFTADAEL